MYNTNISFSQNVLLLPIIFAGLLTACGGESSSPAEFSEVVINTAPTVTLECGATEIFKNSTFSGCEYTVSDHENSESALSIVTSFEIDTSVPGEYKLSITVTDTGGLSASQESTIIVLQGTEDDRDADNWTNQDEVACGTDPDNADSMPVDENENNKCDVVEKITDADDDKVPAFYDWDDNDPLESKDDNGDGIGNYADKDELIHIFISQNVQENLSAEIDQFKAVLEEDTNSQVIVSISPATPLEIREIIIDEHEKNNLVGVFFIGEIPAITLVNSEFPWIQNYSDHPYRAPYCNYTPDETNSSIFYNDPEFSVLISCLPEIWLSRIDPTKQGIAGLEQIRSYLQKNIILRSEYANWQESAHMNFATPRDGGYENIRVGVIEAFENHPLYSAAQLDIVADEIASIQKDSWVTALKSNIEIATIQVHGDHNLIQFQGPDPSDNSNLVNSELDDIFIKTKYINFSSCSVGQFIQQDYMAATSLFNGDTLLVSAYPNITFVSNSAFESQIELEYRAFSFGASPAEIYKHFYSGSPRHFFGDPTVSIRKKELSSIRPRLFINQEHFTASFVYEIDVGSVNEFNEKEVPFSIMNTGNTLLELTGDKFNGSYTNVNKGPLSEGSTGFVYELSGVERDGFNYSFTVPPGETRELMILFNPDAHNDKSLPSGAVYETRFTIATNDPVSPALTLKVKGVHTKD